MHITFLGAAREVTGSHILVEAEGSKILLDCGIWQGHRLAEERNYSDFAFSPKSISALVVCHAHLDHVGRIPKLYKDGFHGTIYSTAPTKDLAQLVLVDNEKLMREEAEREGHSVLYKIEDVEGSIELFKTITYGDRVEIAKNIFLTFRNAGHILGSAIAVVEAEGKKLAYTSDLGNSPCELLEPPYNVEEADYVICESTYGGRVHEDASSRQNKLSQIISSTIAKNGILLIPSFAIERTQELLHDIDNFCDVNGCEKPTFFLDSPLASKATSVFYKYPDFLKNTIRREHTDSDFFGLNRVKITKSVEESKGIRNAPNPKIIIAGSGMMNGGRILFHARDFLNDKNNSLLIVGYQALGTLGRRLLDGEKKIKIFGKEMTVSANILAIGSYSAHADSPQIISWLSKIKQLKKVLLVHGEAEQAMSLEKTIVDKLKIEAESPVQGQNIEL